MRHGLYFLRLLPQSVCGWATKWTTTLRPIAFSLLLLFPVYAQAESADPISRTSSATLTYSLGGAAQFDARTPTPSKAQLSAPTDSNGFSLLQLPGIPNNIGADVARHETILGDVTVFRRENRFAGAEVMQFGTTLTRGRTTTGLEMAYTDSSTSSRSEVFVDYAMTNSFSLGVAGILAETNDEDTYPKAGVGLRASVDFANGPSLRGDISSPVASDPVFGLSLGFQF